MCYYHKVVKRIILNVISTFFKPPFSYFTKGVQFNFRFAIFPNKMLLYLTSSRTTECGITFTNARCTICEIARVLNTVILPAID